MSIGTVSVGGNDYPVYASVAEADRFLRVRPELWMSWEALGPDDKAAYLAGSAIQFNEWDWKGDKTDADQPNEWPRSNTGVEGTEDDKLPKPIEEANILYSANSHRTVTRYGLSNNAIQEVEAATGKVVFYHHESVTQENPLHPYTDEIRVLLDPYLDVHPYGLRERPTASASRSGSSGAIGSSETFGFEGSEY